MDVFDRFGRKQSEEWLHSTYGTRVVRADVVGEEKFSLARVDETEGPATIMVRVLDDSGSPHIGQPVANHWNVEDDDDTLAEVKAKVKNARMDWLTGLKTMPYDYALVQRTEISGYTGFGLGTGSYTHDVSKGGPHSVWVLSPSIESDVVTGIGMEGMTNHRGPLSLVFQIVQDVTGWALPENEPLMNVGLLADKVRWWEEERVRQLEEGSRAYANAISYSLINKNNGLLYRLERALESLPLDILSSTIG